MRQLGMRLGPGDPSSVLFLAVVQDYLNTGLSSVSQAHRDFQWGIIANNILYVTRRAWVTTKPVTMSSVPSPGTSPIFPGYSVIPEDDWGKLRIVNRGQCHF